MDKPLRWHVTAWGSDVLPDLDHVTTEDCSDLYRKYPFVNISCLDPILLSSFKINAEAWRG